MSQLKHQITRENLHPKLPTHQVFSHMRCQWHPHCALQCCKVWVRIWATVYEWDFSLGLKYKNSKHYNQTICRPSHNDFAAAQAQTSDIAANVSAVFKSQISWLHDVEVTPHDLFNVFHGLKTKRRHGDDHQRDDVQTIRGIWRCCHPTPPSILRQSLFQPLPTFLSSEWVKAFFMLKKCVLGQAAIFIASVSATQD